MRPTKLMMKAFGPYGGTQIIDFTQLEDANMFLIHGPTGAGKTTILDAICFALYGQTNGGERSAESMRSKFAKEDEGAEVELEFKLRGELYKVRRSPRFERPKKRGEGTTVEEVKAELYKEEEGTFTLLAAKPQEVDRKIQELLTFNIDQFRQVIMIAQNKFRELLTAPSKERQKILQDIFETGIYQQVERQLEILSSKLHTQVKEKQMKYETLLEHITPEDDESLKSYLDTKVIGNAKEVIECLEVSRNRKEEEVQSYNEKLTGVTQELEMLQEALLKQKQQHQYVLEREKLEEELKFHLEQDERYGTLQKDLEKADKLTHSVALEEVIENYGNQKKRLEERIAATTENKLIWDEKLTQLEEKKQAKDNEEDSLQKKRNAIEKLEGYREKIVKLKEDKQEALRIQEITEECTVIIQQNEKKLTETLQYLMKLEEALQHKDTVSKQLVQDQLHLEKVQVVLERKVEIQNKEKVIGETREAFKDLRGKLLQLKSQEVEATKIYEEMFLTWTMAQAGELAKDLQEHMPCPVCGSVIHPQKAQLQQETVSLAIIKVKEEERRALTGQISKLEEEQNKHREYGIRLKLEIDELKEKLSTYVEDSDAITASYQERLVNSLKEQQTKLQKLEEAQKVYKVKQQEVEQLKSDITTLQEKKNQHMLVLTELRTKLQALQEDLPEAIDSLEKLEEQLASLKYQVAQSEKEMKEILIQLEQARQNVIQAQTVLEETKAQLLEVDRQLKEKSEMFDKEKHQIGIEDEGVYKHLKSILQNKESYTKEVQDYRTKKEVLKEKSSQLALLTKDFDYEKLEEVKTRHEMLVGTKENYVLTRQTLTQQINHLQETCKVLSALYEENYELVKRHKTLSTMTNLAKGRNTKGLSFERYIQSSIFDEVLESANHKLRPMTQSRYELFRTDDLKRKNAQAGLDIAVLDRYVGQMRPVTTLSGGESFMAALALALGLADVIARLAGATSLDTMFIDEGFGTLDEEALEQAIKVLLSLQDTGRLVGIISHVRELREQIPARLEVKTTKTGSQAQFTV